MERTRNKRIGLTQTLSITLNRKRNSNSLENFLRVVLLMTMMMVIPLKTFAVVSSDWGNAPWIWTAGEDSGTIHTSNFDIDIDVSTSAAGNLDVYGGTQIDGVNGSLNVLGGVEDLAIFFDPDTNTSTSPINIVLTFSKPLYGASFLITDIDGSVNNRQDQVTVTSDIGIPILSLVTEDTPVVNITDNVAKANNASDGSDNNDTGTVLVTIPDGTTSITILYEEISGNDDSGGRGIGILGNFFADIDTDGDAIPDSIDLDNDNDGILDTTEMSCSSGLLLDYSSEPADTALNGLTLAGEVFGLEITHSITGAYQLWEGPEGTAQKFNVFRTDGNATNPGVMTYEFNKAIANLDFSIRDLDYQSGGKETSKIEAFYHGVKVAPSTMNIGANIQAIGGGFYEGLTDNTSTTSYDNAVRYTFNMLVDKLVVTTYHSTGVDGLGSLNTFEGGCVVVDTDNDGISDYLDLDSDNDGIPDNVEGQTTADYEPISGTVDANGTYASVYGLAGIIPVDTDEDNISDYLDLDSDNDTLFDIEESGQGVANDGNGRTTVNVGSNGLANSVDTNDDYVDVNGKVNQPESDLSNASGDTSEVAYRELELVATDDTGKSINGSTGGESITNITLNDTLNAISFVLGTDVNITSVTNNTPLVVDLTSGKVTVPENTLAGTYIETYTICENSNSSNCEDANITVVVTSSSIAGTNDTNDTVNGSNGGVAIENITENDTLNGNPVTLGTDANITNVTNNTPLIIDPTTGAVTVPTQTEAGTYTETYTLCENLNPDNCVENNITITVNPAPIDAIDDDFTATPILSSLGGVAGDITPVGNDTLNGLDINGSLTTLTLLPSKSNLTAVTLEVNGTLSVDANTPAGTYNVAYKLCEVLNPTNCDDANVTVVVKAVAIIGSDDTNDTVNGSNGGVAIENITENDTLNGNPVTLGTDANITHVTNNTPLVIDPTTGAVTVPTQTEAGTYTETYTLCENLNPDNCVENNITITVNPAPIDAIDDDFTTNPINGGTGGEIGDITPIGNDTLNGLDINGSLTTLTLLPSESNLTAVTLEGNGTLSLNPNTPAGVYNVAYKLCEVLNQTNCDDANVTVVVETNPTIGNEDNVTATTGKSVVIDVLSNDKDQEDDIDPTTVKIIDPTTGDSVTSLVVVNEGKWEVNTTNGEITFTPEDGFTGDPTPITYVVSDTTGNISEPVSVHVNYPQTAPVAVDDNLTAPITGQAITFNILNNDTDTENDINTTSVKLLGADENQELFIEDEGVWSINLTIGEVTFAPEEGFKGNPTPIKYTVSDKLGEVSNEATISIYYPQTPPIGVDDNQTAQSGETVSILVLNNDSDLEDDIDVTTVGIVHPLNKNLVSELSVPTEGVWSVDSSTGEITFVPEDGFTNDPTPIYYQVSDRLGNRSSETKVMIDYPQTATRAVADVKNGETGKAVTIDILANDIDDENDTVPSTVRLLDKEDNPVTQLVVPNEGTWSINSDTGEVTFTPLEGVTFDPTPVRYTVEDKTGQISLPVTITVNYPQTPVDAKEDTGEANTGEPITIDVLANDSDLEDDIDPTTVKILDRDGNSVTELTIANEGTWRVDPSSGAITFTPEDTFTGDPSMILYTVKDRTGEVSLPVKVTVNYPQTAPEVKDDRVEVEAGTTIVNVLENDWDAENDIDINSVKLVHPVNSTLVDTLEIPNEGTWSVDRENGTVTFTPLDSFTGNPTPISYRVSDTTKEQSLPATVTIIYPQPMALENDIVNNVTSGSSVSIHVLDNDTIKNVVVETLQITGTQNPGDSLVVSGEGVWSIENDVIIFTPEEGFELDPTDITYSVEDINGKRDTKATVTVNYKGKVRPDKKVTDLSLPVTVNVLFNDSGNLNPASVEIVLPEGFKETHPNAILSSDGKELIVPNQGKWVVNSDGTITYTTEENAPIIDPTPISYKVYDNNGNELETDALIILKNQKIAGVSDTENTGCVTCQEYDDSSVPTLNYIGLGLVGLLTTILGLFLFRKEKYTI